MQVNDILNRKGSMVATISPERPVSEVVEVLREHDVGALVVSRDGASIDGIVSERDIVRRMATAGGKLPELTVADVMTAEVLTCTPQDTLAHLMEVMTNQRTRHLPCAVDGRLCGIISIGDVVKARMHELEDEARHLHDYISGSY
jgi:CBS domain-containing protein